jgi:ATP-dependent RNA helicase RhlE
LIDAATPHALAAHFQREDYHLTFESFQFHPRLNENIKDLGYTEPTPIQTQAMPAVIEGRDVMGLAQTGTGKTAAFMLPILHKLMNSARKGAAVRALVIAPTRELAEQINESARELGKKTNIRSITVYGGVSMHNQIKNLRNGADIVVACPGRLLDLIRQGKVNLTRLETLVLDEADQMFDMGFLPDIKRILSFLPEERQTLLFSATMPNDIRRLADEILTNPEVVRAGRIAPAETVSHALYPVLPHLKTALLVELMRKTDTESVLVFTRTKHRAKKVAEQLGRQGFSAASLQGNLSQNKRQEAIGGFRKGKFKVLVATDIAARGIDINLVSHVINYDIPDTPEAYTHRIGRTGRAAKTGDAYTLVSREDRPMIRAIERLLGSPLPLCRLEDFDYDAPAPKRNTEFDRPPRPAAPRRDSGRPGEKKSFRANKPAAASADGRKKSGDWSKPRRDDGPVSWRPENQRRREYSSQRQA